MTSTHTEGKRLRDAALTLLAERRAAIVRDAQRALLTKLLDDADATIDDVRAVVMLPPEINPKVFGAVATPLADAGIIRAAGYRRTARPSAHARPITVWTLIDRAAAVAWLTDHPPLSDPTPDAPEQRTLFD